jgi:hypothetical protein
MYFDLVIKLLPGLAKVLLGVAAVITAWKGRQVAKETTSAKKQD